MASGLDSMASGLDSMAPGLDSMAPGMDLLEQVAPHLKTGTVPVYKQDKRIEKKNCAVSLSNFTLTLCEILF